MNTVKKQLYGFLALLLMLTVLAPPALAVEGDLDVAAEAAVLLEAETGTVLYAKNETQPMYPASLTKIMTLLVAMEELKQGRVDWDTEIVTSRRAWEVSRGGSTSTMFLNIDQKATFKELIKGIAVISANDACVAVAEHLFGSEAAFVQQMNRRAKELGLENSHFVNTHGLHHPEQYMSALDVARLTAYFIKTQPEAAAFQSEREFTFNGIRQFNRNPLLGRFPGADGVKTGYTGPAGWCLVASAEQKGMRLISVVMNTTSEARRGIDSEVLLNYGFQNYDLVTYYREGERVTSVPVTGGRERVLPLVASAPVVAVVPRGDDTFALEEKLLLEGPVQAPVEKGQRVALLQLLNHRNEVVREVELLAGETVERLGFFRAILRTVIDFFSNLWRQGRGES